MKNLIKWITHVRKAYIISYYYFREMIQYDRSVMIKSTWTWTWSGMKVRCNGAPYYKSKWGAIKLRASPRESWNWHKQRRFPRTSEKELLMLVKLETATTTSLKTSDSIGPQSDGLRTNEGNSSLLFTSSGVVDQQRSLQDQRVTQTTRSQRDQG